VFSYSANQFSTGGFSDISETFICERALSQPRAGGTNSTEVKTHHRKNGNKRDITQDAVNEFVEGARSGKLENAAFSAAESTLTAIMARESIYSTKEMTWQQLGS